jgi:AraC-like DNA-binding protein
MNVQLDKSSIENYLRERKPFLNRRYQLGHLSAEVNIPRHVLSRVINQEFGMNFSRLINKMRIEYMKDERVAVGTDIYTLEAVGRECGFNSRNAFIKNFKMVCGSTPSDYFRRGGQGTPDRMSRDHDEVRIPFATVSQ